MWDRLKAFDLTLLVIPALLTLIGLVVIYTVTFPTVEFALARSQLIYAIVGLGAATFLALTDYRSWRNLSIIFYLFGLIMLIALFLVGSKQFGAARWIDLGFFQLQPAEAFKLIVILILARLLGDWSSEVVGWKIVILILVIALPMSLVFAEPDLGTAAVLGAIGFGLLLFGRITTRSWLTIILIALIALPSAYTYLKPYQKDRLITFFAPSTDPQGRGYNVKQATIAIGSGGLFGTGLGRGSQSQLNFLPVAHTDFIFAGLAEATGLVGAGIVLFLYYLLLVRIFRISELARDSYGMYIALGIGVMLAFQVAINVGMNLGLVPVTGIPLPLVSFGGTSLITNLASLGILQSIYMRHKKINF